MMPPCKRCGTPAPYTYCCHCKEKVYELKRSWDSTAHEFMDEICAVLRRTFQELADIGDAPGPLELLAEAWYFGLGEKDRQFYKGQFEIIHEELRKPDPREFLTERELREIKGDEKYHAMKDEGERI